MCGIFGIFFGSKVKANRDKAAKIGRIASELLKHRGPDGVGMTVNAKFLFLNRRLSIQDITDQGNQPFHDQDRKIHVIQNGEIYNFGELKKKLQQKGHYFKSNCDTEVILKMYLEYGLDMVSQFNGMFAIAIYDEGKQQGYLIRDRLGVKPLFIHRDDENNVWFASEIKALKPFIEKNSLNIGSICKYFYHNYINTNETIYGKIQQVDAGTILISQNNQISIKKYWDIRNIKVETDVSQYDHQKELNNLLNDSTALRMGCDASFGAFLSGGIDSGLVTSAMSKISSVPIHTFCLSFDEEFYDEGKYSEMFSAQFKTHHRTVKSDGFDFSKWARVLSHTDQPHGDASFIPMYQISKYASKYVKVILTGDGGDEIFGGYDKYVNVFKCIIDNKLTDDILDHYIDSCCLINDSMAKRVFTNEFYEEFRSMEFHNKTKSDIYSYGKDDMINSILKYDIENLLKGNNLVKPDRMGMANSIEIRSPLLDYRITEYAFKISGRAKFYKNETKSLLKSLLAKQVNPDLVYKRKQMFTVPIGEWMKNVKFWTNFESHLGDSFESTNIFNVKGVRQMITEHTECKENHTRVLRAILAYCLWYKNYSLN